MSSRSQGLRIGLCDFAQVVPFLWPSKLVFGCVVYSSPRQSPLKSVDPVQIAALHTCLGAFRTSPVLSLHVEMGMWSLEWRRQQLCLQYFSKYRSNLCNLPFSCVYGNGFRRLFEARPNIISTLGIRIHKNIHTWVRSLISIAINSTPYIPLHPAMAAESDWFWVVLASTWH